jgi:hypothetical protein
MGILLDTKNSLLNVGHNFNMMFHIPDIKWECLQIPEGIVM